MINTKRPVLLQINLTGFTLIEMAVVLMIVGILLSGMLIPLSAQMDLKNTTETQQSLSDIQEALIGFAIVNGRLPCPASNSSNGVESPVGGGACTDFYDGFVPAATLGLPSAIDNKGNTGFAVDAWGNRIHYAVTSWNSTSPPINDVFTTTNGMSNTGMSNLSPNLLVCSSSLMSSGFVQNSSCGNQANTLTSSGVPAVIFSTGKNGAQGATGVSADELANLSNSRTFVSHDQVQNGFDDLVIWLSPNILINRMVAAGKLP